MKTSKITLILFLALTFSKFSHAQDCNVWLDNMAMEIENNNTEEAVKAMKWFVNCKGNELGLENPVIKSLDKIVYISKFENGYAVCRLGNGLFAITNDDFTDIKTLDENYSDVRPFSEGRALVKIGSYITFVDYLGNETVAHKYNNAFDYSNGVAPVQNILNGVGLIDLNGNEIVPLGTYDRISKFSDGLSQIVEKDRFGYINNKGEIVIPPKYKRASFFSEGLAVVGKNYNSIGFIDTTGKEVIPFNYDDFRAPGFSEGLAAVRKGLDGWGFIDKNGNTVIPFQYDGAESFQNGFAEVNKRVGKRAFKSGFVNKEGREIAPPKYDEVKYFSEERAAVKLNGKWGYIDTEGTEIIPVKYDYAYTEFAKGNHETVYDFKEGFAPVKLNGKFGFVDKTGNEITSIKYDNISEFSEERAAVESNGKLGFIDPSGNEIIPLIYDKAYNFSKGMALVNLDGSWRYIDKQGKKVRDAN